MLGSRLVAAIAVGATSASAACISLSGSKLCPAFNGSFVSTTQIDHFPFLAFVSSTADFDTKFGTFITDAYVQSKYQDLLGCSGLNLSNPSNLYARYTTSVLCNAMVQEAQESCGDGRRAEPLCADTCAQFAISEQVITSDPQTCNSSRADKNDQIRSDFTICALPADSLSGSCISGSENEAQNCGYGVNLPGLCSYCASSSPNSTDTCCYSVDLSTCQGVRLSPTTSLPPLFTTTVTATPTNSNGAVVDPGNRHLSGGAIAGIAIGSIIALALLALLALCLLRRRKRRDSTQFNQPSPRRRTLENGQMIYHPTGSAGNRGDGYEALPSGRIARMSALEPNNTSSETGGTPRHNMGLYSSSSPNEKALQPPPRGGRIGSVSDSSVMDAMSSPVSDPRGGMSSPAYNASSQSEQLGAFKDYYSKDMIKPGDDVATLWAYAPRAKDEFELERGDMLRVIGIWDDGWATGVRISGRADNYMQRRQQRDSGLSAQTDVDPHDSSSPIGGDVKAFPLVCVCLPEHWQPTIDREIAEGYSEQEGMRLSSDDMNEKSSSSPERRVYAQGSSRFNDDLHVARPKR